MLLSEAKEQAQVLLNEAFYAYHANVKPQQKLRIGPAKSLGRGIYFFSSASPNYKGTPNGRSWMVPNNNVGSSYGRYLHKCLIPGDLDKTVLYIGDFTFSRISKGKIKSINDIYDFLERYSASESAKNSFLEWKNKEMKALSSLKKFLSSKLKDFLSADNKVNQYLILNLYRLIDNIQADHFISYEVLQTEANYREWAEDNLPKQCTLLELLSTLRYAYYANEDVKESYLPRLKKLIPKYFKINLQDYPYDVKELYSLATRLATARLTEICKDIYKYFACMEIYVKKFYCVHSPSFFERIFGNRKSLYKNKDFFRPLDIIGFYYDTYGEDDIRAEEIVIWDPDDVTVTAIKDIGRLDPTSFDDLVNIAMPGRPEVLEKRPKWDKDGYPLDKYINYDSSELPEQNIEIPTNNKMSKMANDIEDRHYKDNLRHNTYIAAKDYTTKNPHYRGATVSRQQPAKNTGNTTKDPYFQWSAGK